MNARVKMAVYGLLAALALLFGWRFYANYSAASATPADPPAATTNADPNAGASASSTATPPAAAHGNAHSRMIIYLAAFLASAIGLGLLIAYDATQMAGGAAVDFLFDDQREGERDPEYDAAEQAWAAGQFLEAIRMMREFLEAHPRAQYAALRIAEIYEKDLNNPLAAALEYEEILKRKLPAERWGWSAIHLCNLYSKLNQQDKTRALLERVANEYPKTGAAKKARQRLGLPEPEPEAAPAEETEAAADPEAPAPAVVVPTAPRPAAAPSPAPSKPAAPEPPKPSLPPGFRPK